MTKLLEQLYSHFSKFSYWTIPPGIEAVLMDKARLGYILASQGSSLFTEPSLRMNRKLRNIHAGQRCFILGNGPSICHEDLIPLKNEICMSVSNFYKHPSYPVIRPRYHCVPNVCAPHTEEDIIRWFTEMHEQTLDATLFLGFRQKKTVRTNRLFFGRNIHFLLMEAIRPADDSRISNIAGNILNPQSVPVMCLIIALYMGFSKIYLLGIDHDQLRTGVYNYFYDRKEMLIKDPFVSSSGMITTPRLDDFQTHAKLWRQYMLLHTAAKRMGVDIVNLNKNSYLDIFPFNSLSDIL